MKEPRKRKIGDVEPVLTALEPDKFGALRGPEGERPSVLRRMQATGDSSTGSFTPLEQPNIQGGGGDRQVHPGVTESRDNYGSTWSRYIELDLEDEGTSQPFLSGGERFDDPSSHSSMPISCTLHERTTTSSAGAPTLQQQFGLAVAPPPEHVSGSCAPSLSVKNSCS
jgi:hypothetical protein